MKYVLLLGLFSTLALSACGGGGASSSSIPAGAPAVTPVQAAGRDVSGAYSGSYTSNTGRSGTLALHLSQSNTTISGSLDAAPNFGDVSLRLTGSLTRTGLYFATGKTSDGCIATFFTDDTSQDLSGTFTVSACPTNANTEIDGTFSLTETGASSRP